MKLKIHLIICLLILSAACTTFAASKKSIESKFVKVSVTTDGNLEVLDKQSGIVWQSTPFGENKPETDNFDVQKRNKLLKLVNKGGKNLSFQLLPDGKTIDIFYESPKEKSLTINLFNITDKDKGYVLLPVRMGMLIPSDNGVAFTQRFPAFGYECLDLEMMGFVKRGSALLVSWHDPNVSANVTSEIFKKPSATYKQIISSSITLSKTAKSFRLIFLGKGNFSTIAKAYRKEAKEKGWLVTWDDKLIKYPEAKKLFGAPNIKLWSTLSRSMSEDSSKEMNVNVHWTFDEAAQVAEHLKNDLKIDKALFTLGGWINRGYDNRHPDILPAAPECGGNKGLTDCSDRVKKLGYLFCLHDNYQDMYLDSPSWNEDYIMRDINGNLVRGGTWAGGKCYVTCSKKALELAKRPEKNLPAVKKLFAPNSYFIDTTFAAPPLECFSKEHPITKSDDIKYKQELSDYSRELFGTFGSECGKEWAIPHADFFEGIAGVNGRYYHGKNLLSYLGAVEIPLFNMIYHDCISAYGKYGYDMSAAADYVLSHISAGNHLNYHAIMGNHLYWKSSKIWKLPVSPSIQKFEKKGPRKFAVTYEWKVNGQLKGKWKIFTHFTDSIGSIKFQNDYNPKPGVAKWKKGVVKQGPFIVEIPDGLEGKFDVMTGMFGSYNGTRAVLQGERDGEGRYKIGAVIINKDGIKFEPPKTKAPKKDETDLSVFCRSNNGWAEDLQLFDIFLKNTHEILSPLNEITAKMVITDFDYLSPDYKITKSVFGENKVVAVVNRSNKDFNYICKDGSTATLPPLGFVIESPEFIAFHAKSWNGINYDNSTIFTIRSLDKKPINKSKKIRVFHGFGDSKIKIGKNIRSVNKEEIYFKK